VNLRVIYQGRTVLDQWTPGDKLEPAQFGAAMGIIALKTYEFLKSEVEHLVNPGDSYMLNDGFRIEVTKDIRPEDIAKLLLAGKRTPGE
jgi:hypothetical protein